MLIKTQPTENLSRSGFQFTHDMCMIAHQGILSNILNSENHGQIVKGYFVHFVVLYFDCSIIFATLYYVFNSFYASKPKKFYRL